MTPYHHVNKEDEERSETNLLLFLLEVPHVIAHNRQRDKEHT